VLTTRSPYSKNGSGKGISIGLPLFPVLIGKAGSLEGILIVAPVTLPKNKAIEK
jgi:hypothetical protein